MSGNRCVKGVVELRDDRELEIERKGFADATLGEEYDALISELIKIGRTEGYLFWGPDEEVCPHQRTRQIGEILSSEGGMDLMKAACYRVVAVLGSGRGRDLEIAWDDIGEWSA
jgi:hypothetical protein